MNASQPLPLWCIWLRILMEAVLARAANPYSSPLVARVNLNSQP